MEKTSNILSKFPGFIFPIVDYRWKTSLIDNEMPLIGKILVFVWLLTVVATSLVRFNAIFLHCLFIMSDNQRHATLFIACGERGRVF